MAQPETDRMPPIPRERMDEDQRAAADELLAGPRKGVKGPFIPLLRSPRLMARLQKVGEYLRFEGALPARISELVTLVVAREWSQQFEWITHEPLALQAGVSPATVASLREGSRPDSMGPDEALAYDFVTELLGHRGVAEVTYARAVDSLGERGVIDLVALVGYFATVSMVLNVARTPAEASQVAPLPPLPR